MPSSHLILCRPLLLLPPIPPSIRVFSNEATLRMRWPKYWSLSFSIIPSKEIPKRISFRMDWLDLLKGLARVFSNTTVQKHQFFGAFELWYWRRLFRVPWTARRSNQSILKEISPGISLEGIMLKLKLQYFARVHAKS